MRAIISFGLFTAVARLVPAAKRRRLERNQDTHFSVSLDKNQISVFSVKKLLDKRTSLPSLRFFVTLDSSPSHYAAGRLSSLAIITSNASTARPRIAQNTRGETSEAAGSALPLRSPSGVSSNALAPRTVRDSSARS